MRYFCLEFIFGNAKNFYSKLLLSLILFILSVSAKAENYELSQGNSANSLWIFWSDIPSRRRSEVRISKDINGSFVRIYKSRRDRGSIISFGDIGQNIIKFDSCYKTWYYRTKCSSTIKSIKLLASPTIVKASTNSIIGSVDISWAPLPTVNVDNLKLEVSKNSGPWEHILYTQATSYTQSQLSDGSYKYRLTVVSLDNPEQSDSFVSNGVIIPPPKKVIFIHTDLLGTPVAESRKNGGVL
jgi:hypothetical protein